MDTVVFGEAEEGCVPLSAVLEDIASMDRCPARLYKTYCFGFGGERFIFATHSGCVHRWLGLMKAEAQYHLAKFIQQELAQRGAVECIFAEKAGCLSPFLRAEARANEHGATTLTLSLVRQ